MATGVDEYDLLQQWVRWDRLHLVFDPWAGSGATQAALGSLCPVVLTDVVQRSPRLAALANAVEPADMERVVQAFGRPDAVVASPFFLMNDLALPSAIALATAAVFLHVRGDYVLDAPPARRAYLSGLAAAQRLVIMSGPQRNPTLGKRLVWVAVFASAHQRQRLLRPSAGFIPLVFGPDAPRHARLPVPLPRRPAAGGGG